MTNPAELFEVYDSKEAVNTSIESQPPLCMILNKDLEADQMFAAIDMSYVFIVEHNNIQKQAVACGMYKKEQADLENIEASELADSRGLQEWFQDDDTTKEQGLTERVLEKPLCILLKKNIRGYQLEMLKQVWELIRVKHAGKKRWGIACAYYNPDLKVEAQVISQRML